MKKLGLAAVILFLAGCSLFSSTSDGGSGSGGNMFADTHIGRAVLKVPLRSKASDIYSLGVILFELLNTFTTTMEKTIDINNIKNNIFSKEFTSKYNETIHIILKLINKNIEHRLTINDILRINII